MVQPHYIASIYSIVQTFGHMPKIGVIRSLGRFTFIILMIFLNNFWTSCTNMYYVQQFFHKHSRICNPIFYLSYSDLATMKAKVVLISIEFKDDEYFLIYLLAIFILPIKNSINRIPFSKVFLTPKSCRVLSMFYSQMLAIQVSN